MASDSEKVLSFREQINSILLQKMSCPSKDPLSDCTVQRWMFSNTSAHTLHYRIMDENLPILLFDCAWNKSEPNVYKVTVIFVKDSPAARRVSELALELGGTPISNIIK